ncbi:hypothetical protein EMIHUDRAFT_462234 [Emiliania huxleyi CCMP1516]|uniref:Ribonuclease n=2 Tax=Emiliania huxleyi TaxID=2903 RepID=A0A0D3KQI5_EMIH1|nr:hypothetical protein EMIHUDRAFT_462234 [Emiliania huxleyi CCMP1516]EOD38020.1 hypothetical protein EMIHUDRAFT_462234 [Emiliania huxleyi CCMP1516]|eukprot:XP_005790449.1 hypothetical protein EMIHUDRAFT_462234 [Emiliania huxleyi CCMP1516]
MSGYPDRTTPKWVAADSAGRSATRCIPLDGCVEELRSSQDEVMMGIDEAGRGPTLGPMVYGSAYCRVADLDKLKAMGFADSKTLTEAKREALWADLRASGFLGWRIRVLHAQEIAAGMLRRPSPYNLNAMSHDAAIGLVREVIELGVNLRHLYVDTRKLEGIFPSLSITVAKKADSIFPVPRDAILAGWRFEHPSLGDGHEGRRRRRRQGSGHVQDVPLGDDYSWGCGYPGDKETELFLGKRKRAPARRHKLYHDAGLEPVAAWTAARREMSELQQEFVRVCGEGASPRVVEEGWAAAPASFGAQFAAVAYLTGLRLGEPTPVERLVRNAGISVKDFFGSVEEQHLRLHPGEPIPEALRRLKEHYMAATVAWKKYDQLFATLFPSGFVGAATADQTTSDDSKQLGWCAFLVAKCLVFGASGGGNVLDVYHLLVCVIELLLSHLPLDARGGAIWQSLGALVPKEHYPMPAPARAALHAELKADPDRIYKLDSAVAKVSADLRATLGLQQAAGGPSSAPGLLRDAASLRKAREAVDARYAKLVVETKQPLDDRALSSIASLPSASAAGGAMPRGVTSPCRSSSAACARSGNAVLMTPLRDPNPPSSPAHSHLMATPMSGQLECVGWLRAAVRGVPAEEASEALAGYFAHCSASPAEAIEQRLDGLCDKLRAAAGEYEAEEIDEQCVLGRRLYHKMLLAFLESEERRLQHGHFVETLLSQGIFHSSLFACCMECVFASYCMQSSVFPQIMHTLDLSPFDLYKVIDPFVKHEPSLPQYLRVHFREVEVKILEHMAWALESPLHAQLREYDALLASPEAAGGESRAATALEQFLKKVKYLAASRVNDLCLRLLLRKELVAQIWECIKVVVEGPARHLMRGRHLDQIIMCTIYGVCKVNKRQEEAPKTFRDIIEQYKRQDKAAAKVFREDHLLRILDASRKQQRSPCSTLQSTAESEIRPPSGVLASPQRVLGDRDVFVSHPRTPVAAMTPRTRTLYAFGDSPSGGLLRINHQLASQPRDGSDAANALRALSTTPSHGAASAAMPAPAAVPAPVERKRSHEGGMSKKQLQRRLADDGAAIPVDRSSSHGSSSG